METPISQLGLSGDDIPPLNPDELARHAMRPSPEHQQMQPPPPIVQSNNTQPMFMPQQQPMFMPQQQPMFIAPKPQPPAKKQESRPFGPADHRPMLFLFATVCILNSKPVQEKLANTKWFEGSMPRLLVTGAVVTLVYFGGKRYI